MSSQLYWWRNSRLWDCYKRLYKLCCILLQYWLSSNCQIHSECLGKRQEILLHQHQVGLSLTSNKIIMRFSVITQRQHTVKDMCNHSADQDPPVLDSLENSVGVDIKNKKRLSEHKLNSCWLSNSYTMGCPHVRGDNPRALASGLSYPQVDKHGITNLYHLHQSRPCTSQDTFVLKFVRVVLGCQSGIRLFYNVQYPCFTKMQKHFL